jgi:glyoxylase-like metal-dependent hydrolase (beta-lactamase superfamily II)
MWMFTHPIVQQRFWLLSQTELSARWTCCHVPHRVPKYPLSTEKIGQGVFVFRGAGGNVTAISGSDGCAVIDTAYGPRVDEIKNGIALAFSRIPDWLINTHWHFDHTDGNQAFVATGVTMLAHTNCRVRLSHDQYVPSLEWAVEASPRVAWPTITIDGPGAIDLGLETLQLIPQRAAHTDGDLAVFLPSRNVLIMGDLFTNGSYSANPPEGRCEE